MPVEFVAGDLFENAFHAQAFAQGCNCQGSMGAGIAKTFRDKYPEMAKRYREMCKSEPRQFNLGDAWLWKADEKPWVFNLGTQEQYWHARASYEAIEAALQRMREVAAVEGISSIAAPRIGVGYGGLSWRKVKEIIERVYGDWSGRLIVYETFVASTVDDQTSRTEPPGDAPQKARVARSKTRMGLFQFRALTIVCSDIKKSVRFYEQSLGATVIPTDNGMGHKYRLGTLELVLLPNASERTPATFPDHAMSMLWLEVQDLDAARRHLIRHRVEIVDEGDGQYFTVADPDGLLIEVWVGDQ